MTLHDYGFVPSPSILRREDIGTLLKLRGLETAFVEIGTHRGVYAEEILKRWDGQLFCVDPWQDNLNGYGTQGCSERPRKMDYDETLARLKPYEPRFTLLRMTSEEAAGQFDDLCLDGVYIDGNHMREYVRQDIEVWWPKVRHGGVLSGHDLNGDWADHVAPVVKECVMDRHGVTVYYVLGDAASWYCFKHPA